MKNSGAAGKKRPLTERQVCAWLSLRKEASTGIQSDNAHGVMQRTDISSNRVILLSPHLKARHTPVP